MAQQFNPQTVKKAAVANSTGRKRGPKTAPTLPVNNNWGGMTSLAQRIEWLKNNPAFDEVPATMEEFLGPRYLDIDPTQNSGLQKGVGIRPGVKKALIDIFGKGVDPNSISLIKRGMFTGGIGVGKQFDLDEKVLTPTGWKRNGDLKVGDSVIGKNGKATKVLAVFDNDSVERYRVHFKDGTWINAGADHKWEVSERKHIRDKQTKKLRRGSVKRVLDTQTLARMQLKYADSWKFDIPLVDPVEFELPFEEIVDGYTLGWYIGNGSTRNAGTPKMSCHVDDFEYLKSSIVIPDCEFTEEFDKTRAGASLWIKSANNLRRNKSNPFAAALDGLGLFGVHTLDKFIPESYKTAPVSVRLELLRGLMDSDGCANAGNRSQFSTSSRILANDVCDLVRSLGGYCTLTSFDRFNTEYIVHVNMDQICPFKIPRKASKWKPRVNQRPHRSIVKVEKIEDGPGRCIMVDNPDHLYVAKDYIVSHNSTLASIALTYMVHWVSCLHDPQGYFGLLPGSRIAFMMMSTRASHAQEVLFGDIKARINSCEWFKKNCPHDEKLTKQLRFPKDIWVIPGTSQETSVEGYNVLCQDEKATALTKRGWLRYDQIDPDTDELLTLDHKTGLAEWNPIQRMNIFEVENAPVKRMENSEFSSVTSLNHKWPVLRRVQRDKKRVHERTWTTSLSMKCSDSIPISAVNSDRPEVAKYSDALVEAIAWYYTEGWVRDSLSGVIYQNLNSEGYGRIKQCMTELFGDPVSWIADHDLPCWRETLNQSGGRELSEFRFSRGAGKILAELAPNKVPSHEFLLNLTQSQLEMFINISMLADNRGPDVFSQKNHASAEAFGFAAILSGRSVSIKKQWQPVGEDGYYMLSVRLMKKTKVNPVHAARYGGTDVMDRHTGILWCPTVKNSSFLTRREGNVYFTGNCAIIDEGDSHKVTQEKDYAEEGWNTLHGRIASRFTDPVIQDHRGLLLAIGQMKKANGFMAKKKHDLLTDGKPNQLVVEMTIWDSLGWDRFMKGNQRDSFFFDIVRKKQATPAQAYGAGKNIIEIPNAYFKDFDNDPIRALKDHAGIPPAVEDPFITLIDRVDDAQDKWAERFKDKYKYTVDSSCTMPQFHPDFEADSILKRAVHVDIAFAPGGDAMGMAMGHIPELVEIDGELKPRIVFDFLLRMKPSGGDALQLADFRKILYHLRDDLKFKIGVVTFDGFNSMDSIQILRKKHFNVGEMSVDRTKAPYEELREAIYERRIEFPKYMTYLTRADTDKVNIARLELSELQDTGRKIDHPPKGSKDIADAMAGVVYDLMSNVSFRRGSKRDMTEQRIAEDEMEYNSKVLGDSFSLSQDEFAELSDLLSAEPGNPRNPISTGRPGYGLPPIEKDPFGLAGLNMP